MKVIAATHFLWAGLAVGIVLAPFDYLFLMVFAGFALVLARFVRVHGGFIIGSGFALQLLGVPDEQALAMILFNHILSIVLMVGFNGMTIGYLGYLMEISPNDQRPAYSAYFNALASPAAVLPLAGAAIADVLSLTVVFVVAFLAAAFQMVLYVRLSHWEVD